MAKAGELSVQEFARWRKSGTPHVLLDVREDEELALASLEGAMHIPMAQVPKRLDEIPRDAAVVVMCHVGYRSQRVADFLAAREFPTVYNLTGGIDDYAATVDPQIPRYG